jgi:peroxiredoxin
MAVSAGFVQAQRPDTLEIGEKAPPFTLPGVDGEDHSLSDYQEAEALVLVFTCNHCPTAQLYEERLKQLTDDFSEKGVQVVAVSPNSPEALRLNELGWTDVGDTLEDMKIRAEDQQFNFPYLYDGDKQEVAKAYGPVATPHVFVFDEDRKLQYQGGIDDSPRADKVEKTYLRDAIEAVLADKEPKIQTSKVIGCSVKWASKKEAVQRYMEKIRAEPVSLNAADAEQMKQLRTEKPNDLRLVTFWATWCAPCIVEFGEFVDIHHSYRHRGLEVVTVSLNAPDMDEQVLEFLEKKHASCRNYILGSDDREALINAFNPEWQGEVPYTVLIDDDGNIVYEETGSIDPLALRRAIVKGLGN